MLLLRIKALLLYFCRLPKSFASGQGSDKTSDAGSRYRCGRVGRGIKPPPHPTPSPPPPHTHNHNYSIINASFQFSRFRLKRDGPTDQRMDRASYRAACPQLKRLIMYLGRSSNASTTCKCSFHNTRASSVQDFFPHLY